MKDLLEQRNKVKKKKPKFYRQDSHKKAKLELAWRKPKGLHSKMRLGKRGYRRSVEIGWGSPRAVKGLHRNGLAMVTVHNTKDLEKIDPKKQGALVAATVGQRKRIQIAREAIQKKITVLNMKDPAKYIEEAEAKMKAKLEEKKKPEKKGEKKQEKKPEKEPEKKEETSDEEKKKKEKQEKDKLLTRPEK
ncbi:MAG: 50S ribosomal protein L32e [Candidatus Woesearchaeota archaeon]